MTGNSALGDLASNAEKVLDNAQAAIQHVNENSNEFID